MLILWPFILADRTAAPPREDLPLPTQPPYTAFIGNLAFDLTEIDLEEFFTGQKVSTLAEVVFPRSLMHLLDKVDKDHQRQG